MRLYSLPKSERLLNRKDFVNLNRLGKRYRTKYFVAIYKKAETGNTRLGITVGRKVGNAVRRNRIKRLIREYYRLNKECFPRGYDIVIIARKDTRCLNYAFIKEELSKIVLD